MLFPPIEPYHTELLAVSLIHTLYVERSGNPAGNPVLFLHGGPGGGTSGLDRRYFDPKTYNIILFDQRGSGKSTPRACLEENTTWTLVQDIETIRTHYGIDKWVVFGGSWGSTLSLTYAISHPDRVKALVLRGIFTLRKAELDFFYQHGADFIFPEYWDGFLAPIPKEEHHNLMHSYHKYLTGDDKAKQLECALAWSKWECATSKLVPNAEYIAKADEGEWAIAFARIGFFDVDGWILNNIDKIRHIPGIIVQGRYDVVCPMKSAWELNQAWPESTLHIMTHCGHSATENDISNKLVEATEIFKSL